MPERWNVTLVAKRIHDVTMKFGDPKQKNECGEEHHRCASALTMQTADDPAGNGFTA